MRVPGLALHAWEGTAWIARCKNRAARRGGWARRPEEGLDRGLVADLPLGVRERRRRLAKGSSATNKPILNTE